MGKKKINQIISKKKYLKKMSKTILFAPALIALASASPSFRGPFDLEFDPLVTVPYVNVSLYEGTWYEIARKPAANLFELDCKCNTAIYGLNPNKTISVNNTCYRFGKWDTTLGYAYNTDSTNARLKVKFPQAPTAGNYDIIGLDKDYKWALVGDPSRLFLWILSREPTLDDNIKQQLLQEAQKQEFKTSDLIYTTQDDQTCGWTETRAFI